MKGAWRCLIEEVKQFRHIYVCMQAHICMHAHTYAHTYANTQIHTRIEHTHTDTHTGIHLHTCVSLLPLNGV